MVIVPCSSLRHHDSEARTNVSEFPSPLRVLLSQTWDALTAMASPSRSSDLTKLDSAREQLSYLSALFQPVSVDQFNATQTRHTEELTRADQDELAANHRKFNAQLTEITTSRAWRAITWYRRCVMPGESRWRRIAALLVQTVGTLPSAFLRDRRRTH
jgi:hypothetical protein